MTSASRVRSLYTGLLSEPEMLALTKRIDRHHELWAATDRRACALNRQAEDDASLALTCGASFVAYLNRKRGVRATPQALKIAAE